ncbi:uncharacterized protein LAESUDRAFT_755182 [Laetiporus sulphureus 93-53]|uniref:Uncharacterized protein n=1 Tax=Laetiporus sulphureus 93-53 TaxID=1314785 RepID=A0A165HCG6_9APHY|nr:uncharacterized protein LAESUDRAFT_755182 [Laetiporus sulphureus 93-53]KZT11546.1 hypothetical protein LAESUDRAFT_755182 [Laetiporus sulphureus 93-53]
MDHLSPLDHSAQSVDGTSSETRRSAYVWHHTVSAPQVDITPLTLGSNPWITQTPETYIAAHGTESEREVGELLDEGESSEDEMMQGMSEGGTQVAAQMAPVILQSRFQHQNAPLPGKASHPSAQRTASSSAVVHFEIASMPEPREDERPMRNNQDQNVAAKAWNTQSPIAGIPLSAFANEPFARLTDNGLAYPDLPSGTSGASPAGSVNDTELSKLMQAMSLAVANGIEKGVQKALNTMRAEHKKAPSRAEADERGYYGDEDEVGDVEPSTTRSQGRTGPRDNNLLNCVLPTKGQLPRSASLAAVKAFADGLGDGPDIDEPLIDWEHELSTPWNKELLFLLSKSFLQRIKSGQEFPLTFDPDLHNMRRTDALPKNGEENAALRRNTRRQGIFNRRMNIINANKTAAQPLWSTIKDALNMLDVTGMSSDHTDDEASQDFKVVRRAKMPWRHEDLDVLCHAIDTYRTVSTVPQARGNRTLPRLSQLSTGSPKSHRQYVRGLPNSFYDQQWLSSLTRVERRKVGFTKAIDIPQLAVHEAYHTQ